MSYQASKFFDRGFVHRIVSVLSSRLFSNFAFLGAIQVLNYIVPLLTLPYLARILGPSRLGVVLFAQTFMQYFVTFNDYGFNLSATRKVATIRENKADLNQMVSSIFLIKLVFLAFSLTVLLILCSLSARLHTQLLLLLCCFGFVVGTSFTPTWFFLGHENMKPLALVNFFSKILLLLSLFLFVRTQDDYINAALISSCFQIFVAIGGIILMVRMYKVRFESPSFKQVRAELRDGWTIFVSTMSSSFYLASNTLMLGLLGSTADVGLYSAGEKIMRSIQWTLQPVYQTVFPHIAAMQDRPFEQTRKFILRLTILLVVLTLPCSILLCVFSNQICVLLLGVQFSESAKVIRILAWLPFICCLGNLLGTQIMINFSMDRLFRRVILINSILGVGLSYGLISFFGYLGSAWAILIYELVITISLLLCVENSPMRFLRKPLNFKRTDDALP